MSPGHVMDYLGSMWLPIVVGRKWCEEDIADSGYI